MRRRGPGSPVRSVAGPSTSPSAEGRRAAGVEQRVARRFFDEQVSRRPVKRLTAPDQLGQADIVARIADQNTAQQPRAVEIEDELFVRPFE